MERFIIQQSMGYDDETQPAEVIIFPEVELGGIHKTEVQDQLHVIIS